MERAEYLYAAPHLSTSIPFVIPTFSDFQRSKFFLNCGMLTYKFLTVGQNQIIASAEQEIPSSYSISAQQLGDMTGISDTEHTGGVVFYERHMLDSERMVLAILQTARHAGAEIHNYVSASDFKIDGNAITGLKVKDELSNEYFDINSNLVINAAGPWVDQLNSTLPNADEAPSINGYAMGSHLSLIHI